MKAVKGKLLNRLKTMKSIGYSKPERILQVNASDGYSYTSPQKLPPIQEDQDPEIIDVADLMRDLDDKENVTPPPPANGEKSKTGGVGERKKSETTDVYVSSSFRPPELNSATLFDPDLLAAFEKAVEEVRAREAERRLRYVEATAAIDEEPPLKLRKVTDPLAGFEERCPPGGADSVVLYTTGLRGIRKTFEDCQKLRSLLENLRVVFFERDMSMHSEFKEELWRISGERLLPPRLFIKGRYIGGAEEVLGLHEQGKLKPLMEGMPVDTNEGPCEGCIGIRFVVCFNCNGSRRIALEGDVELASINCSECNENGVIICPFCC